MRGRQVGLFDTTFTLRFEPVELQRLMRPITPGDWGGHQRLADTFQRRVRNGLLVVTDTELADAFRKGWAYGNGTWERYFRAVVAAGKRAGWSPPADLLEDVKRRRAEVLARRVRTVET